MHPVSFAIKLAHLSTLRLTRRETEIVGLTPARLDMLRAILERSQRVAQKDLHRMLGVNNSVISIMVRALERLDFVTRTRDRDDRRTFVVALTRRGRYALRRVYYSAVVEGFLHLALISAFMKDHVPRRGLALFLSRLEDRLRNLRIAFGIGWTQYNPWHATDDDHAFYYAPVAPNPVRLDLAPEPHPEFPGQFIAEDPEVDDADNPSWWTGRRVLAAAS